MSLNHRVLKGLDMSPPDQIPLSTLEASAAAAAIARSTAVAFFHAYCIYRTTWLVMNEKVWNDAHRPVCGRW